MKHLTLVLILISVVACGGGGSSSKEERNDNPLKPCGEKNLCIQPLQYILNTRLTNLSGKIRVNTLDMFEGREVRLTAIDSCATPDQLRIISNATGSSIFFSRNPFMGANSTLEIVDLGADCKGSTVVIKTTVTEDTYRADVATMTVSIDLD